MNVSWDPADLPLVFVLAAFALSWGVLRYVFTAEAYEARLLARGASPAWAQRGSVLRRRFHGGLWLLGTSAGAVLLLGRSPVEFGIEDGAPGRTLLGLSLLCILVLPVVARAARGPEVLRLHPEIRAPRVSDTTVTLSAMSWGVFLLGYEYTFRGVLLWMLAEHHGGWTALGVTSALYMLVHLPKPAPQEAFASLAMGFVFGGAALWSGSFVVAWLLHWAVAVTTETLAGRETLGLNWGGDVDAGAPGPGSGPRPG